MQYFYAHRERSALAPIPINESVTPQEIVPSEAVYHPWASEFLFARPRAFELGGVFHHLAGFNIHPNASRSEKIYGIVRDQTIRFLIMNLSLCIVIEIWRPISSIYDNKFPGETDRDPLMGVIFVSMYCLDWLGNLFNKIKYDSGMVFSSKVLFSLFILNWGFAVFASILHQFNPKLRHMEQNYTNANSGKSLFILSLRIFLTFMLFISFTNWIALSFVIYPPNQRPPANDPPIEIATYEGILISSVTLAPALMHLFLKGFIRCINHFLGRTQENDLERRPLLQESEGQQDNQVDNDILNYPLLGNSQPQSHEYIKLSRNRLNEDLIVKENALKRWAEKRGVSPDNYQQYWSGTGMKNAYKNISREEIILNHNNAWKMYSVAAYSGRSHNYILPFGNNDKKAVFVKTLVKNPKQDEIEIEILKKIQSPWIVSYYGDFLEKVDSIEYICLVMELAVCSLDKILVNTLPVTIITQWALEIAEGLCVLHSHLHPQDAIAHRDLKPSNILLGEDGHLRLADFGWSKMYNHDGIPSERSTTIGTTSYAAPEAIVNGMESQAKATCRSDMYSFGLVLYSLYSKETIKYNAINRFSEKEGDILANKIAPISDDSEIYELFKNLIKNCCIKEDKNRLQAVEARDRLKNSTINHFVSREDFKRVLDIIPGLIQPPSQLKYFPSLSS